jgi:dipeptidase E
MKLLLTAAGLRNDAIKDALVSLVSKPLSEIKVLFVTTAANTGSDDKRWLVDDMNRFIKAGVGAIDVLDFAGLPPEVMLPHFEKADAICVGGGDERYLARMFAAHGLADRLPEWLESKVYMGISAGSMVLGQYLAPHLVAQIFPEEDFGNDEGEGLGLVPFAYIPHLNSSFFSLKKERLDSMKDEFLCPVYVTDDETALIVEDGQVTKVGEGELIHYGLN